jgi:hypothetical protein
MNPSALPYALGRCPRAVVLGVAPSQHDDRESTDGE